MFEFQSLNLTNYLLWNEVEFFFEEGITHVYGKNRSGKSLLFSPLNAIFYDDHNIVTNGRATLQLNDGKNDLDFTVFNKGRVKNNYNVVVNNKEQKTDTIDAGKRLIERYFTSFIQESLFNTTVSISGLQEHPLITGKPSTRLDWLHETLAYASILDHYTDLVDTKIKSVRDMSVKYDVLRSEYDKIEKTDKPTSISTQNIEKIKQKISKLEQEKRFIEIAISHVVYEKPKYERKEIDARISKLEQKLNEMHGNRDKYYKYKKALPKIKQLEEEKQSLYNNYERICNQIGKNPILPQKALHKIEKRLNYLENKLSNIASNNELYNEQEELRNLANNMVTNPNIDQLKSKIKEIEYQISVKQRVIEAHNNGDRHCEMCGNSVKHSKDHIKQLKLELNKQYKYIKKLKFELEVLKAKETDFVEFIENNKYKKELDNLHTLYGYTTKIVDIENKLATAPKLVSFKESVYNKYIGLLDKCNKEKIKIDLYEKHNNYTKSSDNEPANPYLGISKNELNEKLEEIEEQLGSLYRKNKSIMDKLEKYNLEKALYIRYIKQKRDLVEQCRELKHSKSDHEILKTLKKALGKDGFRTRRLMNTLELFVDNLNSLAPLLWDEPFKFDIDISSRKCNMIIHRNNKVGDASKLSGSEKRCWQLLSAISMIRLLPSNRRCDTLILDEPEANMDEQSRHKIMSDLIPEIQKTIPKIVIISPSTQRELGLKPDIAYTVEKSRNKSKLLEY